MFIVFLIISLILFLLFIINFVILLGFPVISSDGLNYYTWLPQAFIFHDYSLNFLHYFVPESWINQHLLQGYIKFPPGSAYLMSPFFFMAHYVTKRINAGYASGYTFYYQLFMSLSAVFYWLLGIILNYKMLSKATNKKIAVLTCFAITYGAGLCIYTIGYSTFAHVYSFFAISLFLYLIIKFNPLDENCKKLPLKSFLIGLILGLVTAIKNFNVFVFIIYILYGVNNFATLKEKIIRFLKPKSFLPFTLGFLIFMTPLICYWHYKTGHFIINSYHPEYYIDIKVDETEPWLCVFDFLHPHLVSALFSLKKGLFTYYPVLIFAVFGLFSLKKHFENFRYALALFMLLTVYILSSFGYWWAGFSFGLRFYIDFLAIFAIPISSFLKEAEKSKLKYYSSVFAIIILTLFSALMSYMVYIGKGNDIGSLFF